MFLCRTLFPLLFALVGSLTLQNVYAQDSGKVEKLEVTGSYIKRIDTEGPSPVQTLDRERIELSGYNSVSDLLREVSANSFGSSRETTGTNSAGTASVNLRGLGADRTLVLLNGKRLAADPVAGFVDLNNIPIGAIERVEILKDGASATYGSDALAGVVNIITRKDYTGTEITLRESENSTPGGERRDVTFVTGQSSSKGSVVTTIEYRKNRQIYSRDREWSSNQLSTFSVPAGAEAIRKDDNNIIQDAGSRAYPAECGGGPCLYDFSRHMWEFPLIDQLSMMSQFHYDINEDFTLYGRVNASRKKVYWEFAPNAGNIDIPIDTFNNGLDNAPAGITDGLSFTPTHVRARNRLEELGNRISEAETTITGYQAGIRGYLTDTWDIDVSYDNNRIRRNVFNPGGYALQSKVNELIEENSLDNTTGFNPFNSSGNRDVGGNIASQTLHQPWNIAIAENHVFNAVASGELFELNGNPVGLAVGSMVAHEQFTNERDTQTANNDVIGSAGSSGAGKRTIRSAFAELGTTLFESLEVQLAGRFDSYTDFGTTANPKLGLRYQATKALMFRASAGTGFKAPTLPELYETASQGNPFFLDQFLYEQNNCTPNSTARNCRANQYEIISSGNPDLNEETSTFVNLGTLYQFNKRTSLGVDAWWISLEDAVSIINSNYLYNVTVAEARGISLAPLGITINRNEEDQIVTMNIQNQNVGTRDLQGIDVNLTTGFYLDGIGDFTISVDHSHMLTYEEELIPGLGIQDLLGTNGRPEWRNNIILGYSPSKTFFTSFLVKTIAEHEKANPTAGMLDQYTEVDWQFTYNTSWNSQFTVGVLNLFDTTPPLDETSSDQLNAALYNPQLQSYYISYSQRF